MRPSFIRFLLFLLAYLPIYIIGALKTIQRPLRDPDGNWLEWSFIWRNNIVPLFLVSLAVLLVLYFVIYFSKGIKPHGTPLFTIKEIKPQHKEYVTYLGTYILPFIALKSNSIFDIIAVALMFITIGIIYSKTKLIFTNPTLIFFGFDIYEVTDENGNTYDCISKNKLQTGDKVTGKKLGDNIFIIAKCEKAS